jgi:predicted secreted protein
VGAMSEIEVTESGTVATVEPGDEVVLRLPENATTGYQWLVDSVAGPVDVVSSDLTPMSDRPGAAGERVVRLRAAAPGNAAARLTLSRAWETEPVERFEVRLDVKQAR